MWPRHRPIWPRQLHGCHVTVPVRQGTDTIGHIIFHVCQIIVLVGQVINLDDFRIFPFGQVIGTVGQVTVQVGDVNVQVARSQSQLIMSLSKLTNSPSQLAWPTSRVTTVPLCWLCHRPSCPHHRHCLPGHRHSWLGHHPVWPGQVTVPVGCSLFHKLSHCPSWPGYRPICSRHRTCLTSRRPTWPCHRTGWLLYPPSNYVSVPDGQVIVSAGNFTVPVALPRWATLPSQWPRQRPSVLR